jgi:hypothetical protein
VVLDAEKIMVTKDGEAMFARVTDLWEESDETGAGYRYRVRRHAASASFHDFTGLARSMGLERLLHQ